MQKNNLSRRNFLSAAASLAVLSNTSISRNTNLHSGNIDLPLIKPPALRRGDRIGIIAPASYLDSPEDLNIAKETIEWLGFKPVIGKNILNQYGYLAGKDQERADDVNEMFKRSDINGIFCIRGGYGTMRILPLIDYQTIKNNPKVIIGYSDITALLLAIHKMTGLVTFHGPVALSTFSEYTMEYLKKAIFLNQPIGKISMPQRNLNTVETENRLIKIETGKSSGSLIGGNLSLYVSLFSTPYDIDAKNKILFFEDVGEEPYRIDRMLTQLLLSGKGKELAGIIIGKMSDVKPKEYKPSFDNTLNVEEIIRTLLEPLKIPIVFGYMIGHIKDKVTIPIGIKATMDGKTGEFSIDESGVS